MIAADRPIQRPPGAKLLVVDQHGGIRHALRTALVDFLRSGDLVVANDAATLPASLTGRLLPGGQPVEVRLAGWDSFDPEAVGRFSAVVFGAGDFRTRTEDREPPPPLGPGDRIDLGSLTATIERRLGHPRLVSLWFDGPANAVWASIARQGRPIQYAHLSEPLALWDVWTSFAGPPVAFEAPSAGFALDWGTLLALRQRGVLFATLTHAAGISSTGDEELDRRLPFDEPYRIPPATAQAVLRARERGGRVVAVGTTVVRALESAATPDGRVRAGDGVATLRVGPTTPLRVVDAILTGVHESGTSHHELLRAFAADAVLDRADVELADSGYRTHEFGDSVLIERHQAGSRPARDEICAERRVWGDVVLGDGGHGILPPDTRRAGIGG
jgi:S-adenosylmethionine:tRNA ribosyltransferase-isomerase